MSTSQTTAILMEPGINDLLETNRRLNRLANGMDSHWQSRAMRAEIELEMWRRQWKHEFDRHMEACHELRDIYLMVENHRGHQVPLLHSVNDCCHPNPRENPGVYANVYLSRQGGIRHERVVDAVRETLEGALNHGE